jgi:hypothetical protein
MKPVSFGATTAASAAAKGAATATKAAGATAAPPPPAPRRPAGAGTQVAGKKASEAGAEPQVSEVPVGPPPPPAETAEDLRAQQRAVREANTFGLPGQLDALGGYTKVPEFLAKTNRPDRTMTQALADIRRADLVGELGDMVFGRDLRDRMRNAVGEYVPDFLSAPPAGKEKRTIAGRDVVVYPRYDNLRADDRGPARLVRLAREAPTPAVFQSRRDALRQAFAQAKGAYMSAEDAAARVAGNGKSMDSDVERAALKARERLQKVVDLREALRELKEPEGNLVID